jgi:c-di-GMP phosphodiesterase Gmr
VMDRTGQRRAEENLRRELISDSLTTLPNRVGFFEIIEELLSGDTLPEDSELMVMVVDLMRFGRINESLGAMTGDELILTIASRLCALQGGEIHIARLGGNEFALLAPLANGVTDAARIAEEVEQAISQPVRLGGFQISVDCALGCCINKVASAEADEMIRRAQSAVRTAKHTGRLEIYRPGVLKAAERRFRVESRLREALGTGELNLVYQPLVDLESGSVTGFEALTRWNDAELGTVYPGEFIEVAEDSGLIVQLGRWSLNEAMQQLARWDNELGEIAPLKMNVNVSPIQMVRDDVVSVVASALRLSGVEGRRLTLELTESAIVDDPDSCRSLLFALKALNVSIAMDDFGTGFSNMASLQSLPIDVLKIDQSFIIEMLNDPDKLAITRAIQSLAQALKLKTTAEGVETAELVSALRDMGCTYGQGYHYAKPMPPKDAFAYWLASRK